MLSFQPGSDFLIPDEISEVYCWRVMNILLSLTNTRLFQHIQSDFVDSRQNKAVTQEDLVLRLTLARLLAISLGKDRLDIEVWSRTKELDEDRKGRR